jgi:hypothetical protein
MGPNLGVVQLDYDPAGLVENLQDTMFFKYGFTIKYSHPSNERWFIPYLSPML